VIDKVTKDVKRPMIVPDQILYRHKGYVLNLPLPELNFTNGIARFPNRDGNKPYGTVKQILP
jgi:hypothetical protein